MACTDNNCRIRPLSNSNGGLLQMGVPLSIVLNPKTFDAWFTQPYTECTIGFIALQKSNDKLVIVTIGDLLTPNPIIASQRTDLQNIVNTTINYANINYPFSFYNGPRSTSRATVKTVGSFANCVPLYITPNSGPITYNQVNAGVIYPFGYVTEATDYAIPIWCNNPDNPRINDASWQNSYVYWTPGDIPIFNVSPPFATTAEIDAITTSTQIMIPAYNQCKYGDCGVKIDSVNTSYTFTLSGFTSTFPFNNLISFTAVNPACGNPIMDKDKGSAIVALINNVWKIIGIVIGFNGATGYGSRIDYIADQLGIKAWDGSVKGFTNFNYSIPPAVLQWKTKTGLSGLRSFTEDNINYRQIGITNIVLP